MLFERTMLSDTKNKELLTKSDGLVALRDAYVFEFLDVKEPYKEKDLRKSIVANLRDFILEFGQDFTFVGEEYRIQVGNTDFFIDLLFYNRALSCLVAIELKVDKFRPEHLGQLNFYLEALDRDMRKPNENPSVGLILCTSKDDTVVEYALSRSMSPTMVADYTLHLPDKTLLENRLRELTQALTLESGDTERRQLSMPVIPPTASGRNPLMVRFGNAPPLLRRTASQFCATTLTVPIPPRRITARIFRR